MAEPFGQFNQQHYSVLYMDSAITEKEHQLLLDAIKDHAIFMIDTAGVIISWNEGAKRLKGFDEEDVIGKNFRMLFRHGDRHERPESEMKKALDKGRFEEDWWRMRKDCSQFWAHIVLQPVFDDNKNHIGFAKVTSDITEKKRLDELNNFLMKEVAGYAIFLLDKSGKVAKWSKAAESIIGFSEEQVIGKSLSALFPDKEGKDDSVAVEQQIAKALKDRYEEEGWKMRKDEVTFGRTTWLPLSITRMVT